MSRLAREKIEPRVREMEQKGDVLPEIRQLMFDNGVSLSEKSDKLFYRILKSANGRRNTTRIRWIRIELF